MSVEGEITTNREDIKSHVINFYVNLFSQLDGDDNVDFSLIDEVITKMVSDAENNLLTSIPLDEEIQRVVFSLDPNNTPGPSGFAGLLFRSC